MKVQCERCREIVALAFVLEGTGIRVHCPSCSADYHVVATALDARAVGEPPGSFARAPAATMTCAKCGDAQPVAPACRRCGLIPGKWRVEAEADASELPIAEARAAATLWAQVEKEWDRPAGHDAFLAHCQQTGSYAYAAARYRAVLARGRDAVAEGRLGQVRALAEMALRRPQPGTEPRRLASPLVRGLLLLAVLLLAMVGGLFYLNARMGTWRP